MTTVKEWAEARWNRPGVMNAANGNVFLGDDIQSITVRAGSAREYTSPETRAWRKQFSVYNEKLRPIVLAEATLADGVYRWPKYEAPAAAKPGRKRAKCVCPHCGGAL